MKQLVVASLVWLVMVPNAWAVRTTAHQMAESPIYKEKAGGMIGRGAINVVTSFVDTLVNVVNETKAGPPFIGTLVGVVKGVSCSVLRVGSGAVDLVTFWVPGFNGFPVSDSYENCLVVSSMAPLAASPAESCLPITSIKVWPRLVLGIFLHRTGHSCHGLWAAGRIASGREIASFRRGCRVAGALATLAWPC